MNPERNPEREPGTRDQEPGTAWTFAFALPPLLLAVASLVLLGLGAYERNPFWPRQDDVTMAEASALRDPGTVAWMIMSGVDPNAPVRIRAGVLDEHEHQLTPGEAAVLADRTEVLATLAARGARVDADVVGRWWCLARATGSDESADYLRRRYPDWTASPCAPLE